MDSIVIAFVSGFIFFVIGYLLKMIISRNNLKYAGILYIDEDKDLGSLLYLECDTPPDELLKYDFVMLRVSKTSKSH